MAHRVPLHPSKAQTQRVGCYYGHAHVRLPRWSPPLPIFFGSSKKKKKIHGQMMKTKSMKGYLSKELIWDPGIASMVRYCEEEIWLQK